MPNLACPTGLRDRAMIAVMLRCGLRVSEACGLYLRDIRWAESQIHIRPEIAKGGREAVVYLDADTTQWLERWIVVRRRYAAGKPHLFVRVRSPEVGGPLNRRGVYKMIRRRAIKADIARNVTPHMLRHTYATQLLGEGFNVREVQHLLRHSDISVTAIYLHVMDSELQAKIRARSPR